MTNKLLVAILFLCVFIQNSFSQNNDQINDLYLKIKKIEDRESDISKMKSRRGVSDRKYLIKSIIDSGEIISKHKIRYYRSGIKKERIKYYKKSKNEKILVLDIIKINELKTYIKYCETDLNYKKEMIVVKEEVLIDNRYYRINTFDKYGVLTKTDNIFISSKDK
ncbi:MAG: hypothetical protein KBB29_08650 [Bacteroidales bacterium]|jgi:hypothetical protein|nr:hypothetical protein [Bacteroidales bacterium]MBP8644079.1 hypothetical protein [Bacteroidales bacterium]HOG73169.1 hypothetical protein [Tenuifilaceae bacterium]